MTYALDDKGIELLKEFDFRKQQVFAYLTCERLYPNYVYFSENYGFGAPEKLRKAIDFLYDSLSTEGVDRELINSLILMLDAITPQPGDHATVLASSAMDACGVVFYALNFLLDKKP